MAAARVEPGADGRSATFRPLRPRRRRRARRARAPPRPDADRGRRTARGARADRARPGGDRERSRPARPPRRPSAAGDRRGATAATRHRPLRGPAIRERAVSASWSTAAARRCTTGAGSSCSSGAGHEIAGKDPLAVFLTQITRSPAVRRGSARGDLRARPRRVPPLAARVDALQQELGTLPATGTHASPIRARRSRLTAEIGRTERALEEVARVLGPRSTLAATA